MWHVRTLLVLGALCWVAPLGAEQREAAGTGWSDADSSCPYARAAAAAAQASQTTVTIETPIPRGSLLGGEHRSAFLP
jgi:hypothetical protein